MKRSNTKSLSILLFSVMNVFVGKSRSYEFDVRMPRITTEVPDTYLCTAVPITEESVYITGFIPRAKMTTAHHLLMFGCSGPGYEDESWPDGEQYTWQCGHGSPNKTKQGPVCSGTVTDVIYAWARDADPLSLPKDTGFLIGSKTRRKVVVLQLHYKDKISEPDSSGVTLKLNTQEQKKKAGVFVMGSISDVAPMSITYMDISCRAHIPTLVHPFAYRTHAHGLGRVISGYKIDPQTQKWTQIGKKDPRLPQMFYPIDNPGMTIKNNDLLAARCTMESDRDTVTTVGATDLHEMCNFYVMYYIHGTEDEMALELNTCWNGTNARLLDVFDQLPPDISEYNGHRYDKN